MHDKNYLLSLLDFSVWANEEFFKTIRELPSEEVTKQRESLMNSILHSVNHLLVIDKVWMSHMKGEKHSFEHLQTILHENLDDLLTDNFIENADKFVYPCYKFCIQIYQMKFFINIAKSSDG